MGTTTLETSKGLKDAVADFQEAMAGSDVTISAGGQESHVGDVRKVVEALCETAEQPDPGTDPWPHEDGEPVEFVQADNALEVGSGLIAGIRRLEHLHAYRIHYLFRFKENWSSKGKTVFGQMKRPTGLLKSYAEADFIVLLNWSAWLAFNPMQRVALVYHELRHGDSDGKTQGHDFEGFFDELALFGTGTYRDWNSLARATELGSGVRHQYTLSLLDES